METHQLSYFCAVKLLVRGGLRWKKAALFDRLSRAAQLTKYRRTLLPRTQTKQSGKRVRRVPKSVLRLPDLDQAKFLNGLSSNDAQRGHRHAIGEFIDWYCSEPRLSFSKSVVLRYRIHLEFRRLISARHRQSPARRSAASRLRGIRFTASLLLAAPDGQMDGGVAKRHTRTQSLTGSRGICCKAQPAT